MAKKVEKEPAIGIAIIGANGIGSFFLRDLNEAILRKHVKYRKELIAIFDFEEVEAKNVLYALWDERDIGGEKATLSAIKYGITPMQVKVTESKQISGANIICLCADNNTVRRLVFESGRPFIDMRAEGRVVSIFNMINPTEKDKEQYLALTPMVENEVGGSCQRDIDLQQGKVQYGHRIAAEFGIQILMNHLRDEDPGPKRLILTV